MTTSDLQGKIVTCYYDIASSSVRLECGRHYEDEDEATFFEDHIPEGAPAGIEFDEVTGYRSSSEDHVHVGRLKEALLRGHSCTLYFVGVEGDEAGEVSFSFARTKVILSVQRKKRPNKAPEPTPGSVTPRATEGVSE